MHELPILDDAKAERSDRPEQTVRDAVRQRTRTMIEALTSTGCPPHSLPIVK